jgi:hypothetical protein
LGRPLTAGGQVFEKGLGVKARSLLTFRPPEGFALFSTLLALDDETEGRGDCLCRVLGDGQVLYEGRIKGKDKPVALELPVKGLRKLTLAVEPGEGYDLSDHIDWCDARWIKP